MKRIICVLIAAAMLLLTSCGTVETNETPKTETENNIGITSTTPTAETEEEIIGEEEEEVIEEEETEEEKNPDLNDYVINKRSKVFHYPECKSVAQMKEKNKIYVEDTSQHLRTMGYKVCGNCYPFD